uniref:Uncharacterized protein n=1 Tax=Tanacetum cinerariifolium TaxID=118510 RepID=A0A6L2KKL2_TANCI|nr:hypothetical protein [Tanacetum cinerariifolium]
MRLNRGYHAPSPYPTYPPISGAYPPSAYPPQSAYPLQSYPPNSYHPLKHMDPNTLPVTCSGTIHNPYTCITIPPPLGLVPYYGYAPTTYVETTDFIYNHLDTVAEFQLHEETVLRLNGGGVAYNPGTSGVWRCS